MSVAVAAKVLYQNRAFVRFDLRLHPQEEVPTYLPAVIHRNIDVSVDRIAEHFIHFFPLGRLANLLRGFVMRFKQCLE
jgi:hypothetical protein